MSHYPTLDDGVSERAAKLGIDIEASTDAFLEQIRTGRSRTRVGKEAMRLATAVDEAPLLTEEEIDRWENRHHDLGRRHGTQREAA